MVKIIVATITCMGAPGLADDAPIIALGSLTDRP